ncbi:Ankyrin repeats (3 copies) family protein [Fusarium austroafricanum]|uniref:Ankyrin repeats (3 copies) family protein n=1 Tax=Fusarium austroafricanum TaxID=2364996 RepID=A0A8H4KVB7_9HYPO|nr:Ankyrin repeats (3 copies) family protein [Fusarium austroafricanum]
MTRASPSLQSSHCWRLKWVDNFSFLTWGLLRYPIPPLILSSSAAFFKTILYPRPEVADPFAMVLTQDYPNPDGATNVNAQADIIAVHGLNPRSKNETNHVWDTWRTPAGPEGKLWLRDDLPKLVPNARVFVYEYDSTVVYGTNNFTFVDKANSLLEAIRIKQMGQGKSSLRPVILLGHSLGGLLIKEALINAYNNEKYKTAKLATQGLVFFATPQKCRKQGLVNLGQVAGAIARNLGFEKGDNRRKKEDDRDEERDARVKNILGDVSDISCVEAKDRNPQRVEGTCQWFICLLLFKQWLKGDSGLLWVSADPGCGKSVLSKYLIDDVLPSTPERITCYFFFKDDIQEQKPDLFSNQLLMRMKGTFLASFTKLWEMLVSAAKSNKSGELVCILDGLDECMQDSREKLIKTLTNFFLYDHGHTGLKFLTTSRPYHDIELGFHPLERKVPTIHLCGENEAEVDEIAKEITVVIASRVRQLAKKHRLDDEETTALKEEILKRSNRTYLWVYLIFEDMKTWGGFTKGRIKEQVRTLPTGLNEVYENIFSKSLNKKAARVLLNLILSATRALTLRDMAVAQAMYDTPRSSKCLDIEKEGRFRANVRGICGLFVSIVDDKVYLIHQTAVEFLLQKEKTDPMSPNMLRGNSSLWHGSFSLEYSNRMLASICARYLLREYDFSNKLLDPPKPRLTIEYWKQLNAEFPFLEDCLSNWYIHVGRIDSEDSKDLDDFHTLCLRGWAIKWLSIWSIKFKYFLPRQDYWENPPQLVIASGLGLAVLPRDLLQHKDTRSDKTTRQAALGLAVELGRNTAVQAFIAA